MQQCWRSLKSDSMKRILLLIVGITSFLLSHTQPGTLDSTFGTAGKTTLDLQGLDDMAYAMVLQNDGKILVGGISKSPLNYDFGIARLNTDGTVDTGFNTVGWKATSFGNQEAVNSIIVQGSGKIVAGGWTNAFSYRDFALARYHANSTLDTSFNTDGLLTTTFVSGSSEVKSILQQPDGKFICAGAVGTVTDFALARYSVDGVLDTTFGLQGIVTTPIGAANEEAFAALLQPDGKIVLAGYSDIGSDDFALVRYNTDGSLDTTFSGDGKVTTTIGSGADIIFGCALQSDGKIVATGVTYNGSNEDFAMARYHTDGRLDSAFGNNGIVLTPVGSGFDRSTAIALQPNGKIVVTGHTENGSQTDIALLRYNTNGTLDSSFATAGIARAPFAGFNSYGSAVTLQPDGKIVVAGYRGGCLNCNDYVVLRFIGDTTVCSATTSFINPVVCFRYTSPSGLHTWSASGSYVDTITNTAGCDSVITINLTINTVDTSVIQNGITLTSIVTGASYQWLDCSAGFSNISGENNQSFTPTANGTFALSITQNGCADTSACYAILSVGMDEIESINSITVSPNPFQTELTIGGIKQGEIMLYDLMGRQVSHLFILESQSKLNTENIPAGFYTLRYQDGTAIKTLKVVKQ